MKIDDNLLTAATLCSRLYNKGELKYLSSSAWHGLIADLAEKGIENPSYLLGAKMSDLITLEFKAEFCKRLLSLLDNAAKTEEIIKSLANSGIFLIGMDSKYYSSLMIKRLQTACPPVLFYAGNAKLMNRDSISVAGSREPSSSAVKFANSLGRKITENGYVLTSGGARGCDSIAESAATSNGGNAVLYLAVSLSKRMENTRMSSLIAQNRLCLVSDHSPYDDFNAGYALTRNKYIYSSSPITAVCESRAEKGGSYNGAIGCIAGGYGHVAAFDDDSCYGNQMLILNGASRVKTADDVIDLAVKYQ